MGQILRIECRGDQHGPRRAWSDPMLLVRQTLPRVTNGMAGSFDPDGGGGDGANGGPGEANGGGKTRNWSREP